MAEQQKQYITPETKAKLETELQEANREYIQSLDEARMYILLTHNRSTIFEARCPT